MFNMKIFLICFLLLFVSCAEDINTSDSDASLIGQTFNGLIHIPTGVAYKESGESCWVRVLEKSKNHVLIQSSLFNEDLNLSYSIPKDNGRPWYQTDIGENQAYILQILSPQNRNQPGLVLTLVEKDGNGEVTYRRGSGEFIKQCYI